MKKYIALLLIFLLICSTGCSVPKQEQDAATGSLVENAPEQQPTETPDKEKEKTEAPTEAPESETPTQNELVKRGESLSFEGLPVYNGEPVGNYYSYTHLADMMDWYHLHNIVIFRGKKEGPSVPVTIFNDDGTEYHSFCETPIRVLEVFYGDLQTGALITHDEQVRVVTKNGQTQLSVQSSFSPIAENEEYIFIFAVINGKAPTEGIRYGGISVHHSYHKLADYELYKQKVANGTATNRENFGYEVMDYYLNDPDTKLDLRREASKYVENLPENATQEEILKALPQEQQEFFDRMIKQYGVKKLTADDKIPGADEKPVVDQTPTIQSTPSVTE